MTEIPNQPERTERTDPPVVVPDPLVVPDPDAAPVGQAAEPLAAGDDQGGDA